MPPAVGGAAAPGAVAAGDGQPQAQQNPVMGILRMLFMWWMFKQFFGGKQGANLSREQVYMPRMSKGTLLDMHVFMSEKASFQKFNDKDALIWRETEIPLAGLEHELTKTINYHPSKRVQNNGTLFVHVFFVETGFPLEPEDPFYDPSKVFYKREMVNRYLPRPKRKEGVNLLSGAEAEQDALAPEAPDDGAEEEAPREIISFFRPNITFAMVDDFTTYPQNAIPPHLANVIAFDPVSMTYDPTIWLNDFWILREYLIPMNKTLTELPLIFSLYTLSNWKFQIYLQMDTAFNMQKEWGAMRDGESDEFKRVLIEGNPFFLGLTFFVSLLHSAFDVLAFKNDIGFWRNKKSVEGLSVRTIIFNCACQLIILLYLMDNDTSFVVLFSSFLGLLIEFWKVTQAMNVTIDRSGPYPKIKFADKDSYKDSNTNQYDKEAMRYLSLALLPCVGGYAVYALMYETHKSWYSWVLNSLVGAVYTFGFILMCPQLYLNYKLKSVAHLPWRQMTYKFLNTIIDDLFAFVIKMPTLHRLSVFRDDIVFLVYLYQRWVYRVDKKRANEFGYVEVDPDEAGPETLQLTEGDTPERDGASPPGSIGSFEDLTKEVPVEQENLRQRRGGAGTSAEAGTPEIGPADAGTNPRKNK